MKYEDYSFLLGLPYDEGNQDCYGLCRNFYQKLYGLDLPNYARGSDFGAAGVDLVPAFLSDAGFEVVQTSTDYLEIGDGLLLSVPARGLPMGVVNHVGVFVGNHAFLHHMKDQLSCEDHYDHSWKRRTVGVLRHPSAFAINGDRARTRAIDLLTLLPDHVRQKYGIAATAEVEPLHGTGGAGTPGRDDLGAAEREPDTGPDVPRKARGGRRATTGSGGDVAHAPAKQRKSKPR